MSVENPTAEQIATQCDCPQCRRLCSLNPGWMLPSEARAAMADGLAPKLMRDWLEPCSEVGNDERIYLIAPASIGYEGADAREFDFFDMFSRNACKGACNFWKDGHCQLHQTAYKPLQCRTAFACRDDNPDYLDNYQMARLWDTDEGRAVVQLWAEGRASQTDEKGRPMTYWGGLEGRADTEADEKLIDDAVAKVTPTVRSRPLEAGDSLATKLRLIAAVTDEPAEAQTLLDAADRLSLEPAGWQPIETVPMTSEAVLVWSPEPFSRRANIQVAHYAPNCVVVGNMFAFDLNKAQSPTHWMPVPKGPPTKFESQP